MLSLAQDFSDGYLVIEAQGLGACVDALEPRCDETASDAVTLPQVCGALFVGLRGERDHCFQDLDCAAGLYCSSSSGESDLAVLRAPEPLEIGVATFNGDHVCMPYRREDESCGYGTDRTCEPGLFCYETCFRAGTEGDACAIDGDAYREDDCGTGLYCDEDTGTCTGGSAVGQECREDRQCASYDCDERTSTCLETSWDPAVDWCGAALEPYRTGA